MSTTPLGQNYNIPRGVEASIVIPDSTAPQNQLQTDVKQQILSQQSQITGDTFKLLASILDSNAGYLSEKITTGEFSIVLNKLKLAGFGNLTTTNLTEGTNLYWTQTKFDSAFTLKSTTNLTEGTNLYYTSSRFNSAFGAKTTDDLSEGLTNLYFTNERTLLIAEPIIVASTSSKYYRGDKTFQTLDTSVVPENGNLYFTTLRATNALVGHTGDTSIHFSDLSGFDTDDLIEGLNNKYLTSAIITEIGLNTAARHSHTNFSLIDAIVNSGVDIADAVTKKHSHTNISVLNSTTESFTIALKATYDGYASGMISSASSPLNLTLGVLTHISTDGNKHVPANSTTNNNKILKSGATAGLYTWETFDSVAALSGIFETAPSTSIVKTLTSNYIKDHVENTLTAKHVTAADLTYIGTTIPAHIASILLHVPSFTPVTDRLKYLQINSSDALAWATSATSIVKAGTGTYVTATGDTITVDLIDFTDTNIVAGTNITIDTGTNEISATWRAITDVPSIGDSDTSVSSGWAYSHNLVYGNLGHVPTAGTSGYFLAWDGTFKDISSYVTNSQYTYKITLGAGLSVAARVGSGDTVYPSGWAIAADAVPTDLNITHGLTQDVVDVVVFADDGSLITKMISSAAYGTIIGNAAKTIVKVTSLATINQKLHLYIQLK